MFHKSKSQGTFISSTYIDKLSIINKNLLYLTHEVDKCVAMLRRMELDDKMQTQVDAFYAPPTPPPTQSFNSPLEDTSHEVLEE